MATKYKSKILGSMHRTVSDLHEIGAADKKDDARFRPHVLDGRAEADGGGNPRHPEQAGVSQAVFAAHIGVTAGLISKWECGDKHPSPMALKLLALVRAKGPRNYRVNKAATAIAHQGQLLSGFSAEERGLLSAVRQAIISGNRRWQKALCL